MKKEFDMGEEAIRLWLFFDKLVVSISNDQNLSYETRDRLKLLRKEMINIVKTEFPAK